MVGKKEQRDWGQEEKGTTEDKMVGWHHQLNDWSSDVCSSDLVAKYWSFSFSISPSNEHSGLISFRMDWLDLLAVQGTQLSLDVQLLHPYMTTMDLC